MLFSTSRWNFHYLFRLFILSHILALANMIQKSSSFFLLLGVILGASLTFVHVSFKITEYQAQKIRSGSTFYANCSGSLTEENISLLQPQDRGDPRILCWVMTGPENHRRKAVHVKATWGKRFDTLVFMSSVDDADLPAVALSVEEGRNFLWGKTREAFNYVYNHYNGTYDWVMKTDDDTYVIVENLRNLLQRYDPNEPLYLGCRFNGSRSRIEQGYMAGGAGYVLSREAVRRLVIDGVGNKKCIMRNNGGQEDGALGMCLNKIGVKALDSRDSLGRDRFLQFPPAYVLNPAPDRSFWYWSFLYHHSEKGPNCCSDTAISFHYIGPSDMYVFEYFLYRLHPCRVRCAVAVKSLERNNNA